VTASNLHALDPVSSSRSAIGYSVFSKIRTAYRNDTDLMETWIMACGLHRSNHADSMCYSTNTAAALNYLRNTMFSSGNGARSNAAKAAVIISNSNSANRLATLNEADLTRRSGIDLATVAVGSWLDPTELQAIASYPADKNTFLVSGGFSSLSGVQQQIQNLACGSTYFAAGNIDWVV